MIHGGERTWVEGKDILLLLLSLTHVQLFCDPTDCSPPASSLHGISQQEYWSQLPFPSPETYWLLVKIKQTQTTKIKQEGTGLQKDSLLFLESPLK